MEIIMKKEDNDSFTNLLSKKTSPTSLVDAVLVHKYNDFK